RGLVTNVLNRAVDLVPVTYREIEDVGLPDITRGVGSRRRIPLVPGHVFGQTVGGDALLNPGLQDIVGAEAVNTDPGGRVPAALAPLRFPRLAHAGDDPVAERRCPLALHHAPRPITARISRVGGLGKSAENVHPAGLRLQNRYDPILTQPFARENTLPCMQK